MWESLSLLQLIKLLKFLIWLEMVVFVSIALYEWRGEGLLILISCEYIVKNPSKSPFALEGSNNGVYEVYRCQRAEATWKPLYCYKSVLIIIPPFSSGMILVITFLTALTLWGKSVHSVWRPGTTLCWVPRAGAHQILWGGRPLYSAIRPTLRFCRATQSGPASELFGWSKAPSMTWSPHCWI